VVAPYKRGVRPERGPHTGQMIMLPASRQVYGYSSHPLHKAPLLISPEPGNLTSYSVARLIPGKESALKWWRRRQRMKGVAAR
jgi:hypothetical protein